MSLASSSRSRQLSLTPAHLAKLTRNTDRPDGPPRYAVLSAAEMESLAGQKLAELAGGPLWVFAYGSLIWNPAFEFVETRRCVAHGWHRSFCLRMLEWRATPEEPGLMLALGRGGSCSGVAYRLPDDVPHDRMLRLLRREIGYHVDVPWVRWLQVRAGEETLRALTFFCAPKHDPDLVVLPLEEQARRLARAVGPAGSCAEYLHNTVDHLESLGINDRYLWRLQAMVAAEIDGMDAGRS